MDKLIRAIESIRSRLDGLRKRSLKETPTRTIIVDPLLEALGWDVRDPDEVQLEYPTVDGKSVDYALLINLKPALLVEAKPLDDPLNDVKGITQVVGYAANDGIVWCVLTNGILWKVYRSVEECAAPDKLMFEVSLDPRNGQGLPVEQSARQMWRFSRDEMEKGTLDALGEQTFTDGKVRKALDAIMRDAPRPFLNIVRSAAGDSKLVPQRIKESLARIWGESPTGMPVAHPAGTKHSESAGRGSIRPRSKGKEGAARKARETAGAYAESHHTSGKPQEVLELYRAIDRFCLSLKPDGIERRYLAKSINYVNHKHIFCSVHLQRGGLRVWLRLKYARLEKPPSFARDMSGIGHWGVGDLELDIISLSQLEEGVPYIRMSFEARTR